MRPTTRYAGRGGGGRKDRVVFQDTEGRAESPNRLIYQKFSHHPPGYPPSLRLFPRLLTPASDFCSQREAFPGIYNAAFEPSTAAPLRSRPPKTYVRVPASALGAAEINRSNVRYPPRSMTFAINKSATSYVNRFILRNPSRGFRKSVDTIFRARYPRVRSDSSLAEN